MTVHEDLSQLLPKAGCPSGDALMLSSLEPKRLEPKWLEPKWLEPKWLRT